MLQNISLVEELIFLYSVPIWNAQNLFTYGYQIHFELVFTGRVIIITIVNKLQCMQLDAKSPPEDPTLHYLQSGEECALPDPQRSVTEHGNLKRKGDAGPSGQNHTICDLGSKQKMDKKMKKTWGIGGSISLNDLKQHFGKKREEAAESLDGKRPLRSSE